MKFQYSRHGLDGRAYRVERALEMLPGITSWTILLGMLILSFWKPVVAAVIVIAFYMYWLFRLFYMTLFLVLSYLRLSIEQRTDWMARVRGMDRLKLYLQEMDNYPARRDLKRRISQWIHKQELLRLLRDGALPPPSSDIYHLVIFPVAKESAAVFEPGIESLVRQTFPAQQTLIVLAVEDRAPAPVKEGARRIQQKYRDRFLDLLLTLHPSDVPGEARVKGANATYAAKAAAAYFTERGIAFDRVIASCFDADTVVNSDYMSCVTYSFMVCPKRTRASFQPIPVFANNIWDAPEFTRVLDIGSSFFQLVEATNPEKLVTFSSHSMSFKALVDVGYWPVDMISDDSAIFWKAFIHFDGDYRAVPLYVTLSMDAVNAKTWWKTAANVYRQKRRWAWGVENFPIIMRAFLRAREIPPWTRVRHAFKMYAGHVSWASWAFLLTIIGWLPALVAGREFSSSILFYSGPRITTLIFHISAVALLVTIVLSWYLLPKPKVKYRLLHRMGHTAEWLCIPVVATFLSALPALDAQTRLMMGRYMEFWVTDKARR